MRRAEVINNFDYHVPYEVGTILDVQDLNFERGGWGVVGGIMILGLSPYRFSPRWFRFIDKEDRFPLDPNAPK